MAAKNVKNFYFSPLYFEPVFDFVNFHSFYSMTGDKRNMWKAIGIMRYEILASHFDVQEKISQVMLVLQFPILSDGHGKILA